jgi:hypothetical protein
VTNRPVNVRIPPDLRDRIDKQRGLIARETWIRDQLERIVRALEQHQLPIDHPIPREDCREECDRYWQALTDIAEHENWEPRTVGQIARAALNDARCRSCGGEYWEDAEAGGRCINCGTPHPNMQSDATA